MKNSELWKSYSDYTGLVSKNIRWIIGMMFGWALFKMKGQSGLILPLLLCVILLLDFMQYIISAVIMRFWIKKKEEEKWKKYGSIEKHKNGKEIDYEKPQWDRLPSIYLLDTKNHPFFRGILLFFLYNIRGIF